MVVAPVPGISRLGPPPPSTGPLNDLHEYDPATWAWEDLSAATSGAPPSVGGWHGFASAGGKLYVHGGACLGVMGARGESNWVGYSFDSFIVSSW